MALPVQFRLVVNTCIRYCSLFPSPFSRVFILHPSMHFFSSSPERQGHTPACDPVINFRIIMNFNPRSSHIPSPVLGSRIYMANILRLHIRIRGGSLQFKNTHTQEERKLLDCQGERNPQFQYLTKLQLTLNRKPERRRSQRQHSLFQFQLIQLELLVFLLRNRFIQLSFLSKAQGQGQEMALPTIPTEQSPFHTLSIGIAQNGSGSIPPELQNDYWPMFRYGGCTSIPLQGAPSIPMVE